jgi:hypothetical protein
MWEEKVTGYETIARGSTARGRLGGQQEFGLAEEGGGYLPRFGCESGTA